MLFTTDFSKSLTIRHSLQGRYFSYHYYCHFLSALLSVKHIPLINSLHTIVETAAGIDQLYIHFPVALRPNAGHGLLWTSDQLVAETST